MLRAGDVAGLPLRRFAHVEEQCGGMPFQIRGCHGRDGCRAGVGAVVLQADIDGIGAAYGAIRIVRDLQRTAFHRARIDGPEPSRGGWQRGVIQQDLDRLHGLGGADHACDGAQNARFGAVGNGVRRRRGEEAAIARSAPMMKHGALTFIAQHGAVDIGLAGFHRGVVDQKLGCKIVRGVDDDVMILKERDRVARGQVFRVGGDLYIRVEGQQARAPHRPCSAPADPW